LQPAYDLQCVGGGWRREIEQAINLVKGCFSKKRQGEGKIEIFVRF
jgi:hypothetical protein